MFEYEDDLLSTMESGNKPFQNEEEEEKPKQQYNKSYSSNGYNSNKPKRVSLWDKKDFTPEKINPSKLAKSDMFAVALPDNTAELPENVSKLLASVTLSVLRKGYGFRVGPGSKDTMHLAFMKLREDLIAASADYHSDLEVYLPWPKFNEDITKPNLAYCTEKAYSIAVNLRKNFYDIPAPVRAILAKDVHVCLGAECNEAIKFLIIYTPCGSEKLSRETDYKKMGNTVFYISLALAANIPVFNVKNEESIKRLSEFIKNNPV